jgi:hypothetical protein
MQAVGAQASGDSGRCVARRRGVGGMDRTCARRAAVSAWARVVWWRVGWLQVGCFGPAQNEHDDFLFIQTFTSNLNFKWSKRYPLLLGNFQKKYGFEAFEIRNNFTYWNLSKFGIHYELKIKEAYRV